MNWLLSDQISSCLYEFDLATRSVRRLTTSDVPWPIFFMLGRRHKKFRYISNTFPSLSGLHHALADSTSRLKWRHDFACREGDNRTLPPPGLLYKQRTLKFEGKSDPALSRFCEGMCEDFMRAASVAISRHRFRGSKHGNVLPVDKAAHAWLEASDFTAIPCDKETGYCLVRCSDLRKSQLDILSGSWYQEVSHSWIAEGHWKSAIVPNYTRIANMIKDVDSRASCNLLNGSLQFGLERLPARLSHTVKMHKGPGAVVFRPIHAASRHPVTGIMSWINVITSGFLSKFRHILHSSDAMVEELKYLSIVDDMIWVHWDIKDLFMMGTIQFLVKHSSLMVPQRYRSAVRAALTFVLDNQYVVTPLHPGRVWKEISGTGLGLRCSSGVADCAFMHATELTGLGIALHRVQSLLEIS